MLKIPDHITEAEVLALIEGDMGLLPLERREVVRAAVASDPALSRLVGEIRSDASTVVSMSRISAPPTIRGRVVEELSKPAPRPEPIREPAGGAIPVSAMIVTRESPWRRMAERAPVRKLAAAASLLLAAGAGVWLVSLAVEYGREHAKERPVAVNPVAPRPADMTVADGHPSVSPDDASAIASSDPEHPSTLNPSDGGSFDFPTSPEPREVIASTGPVPDRTIDAMEAAALARAGRLVVRVRAVDESEAEHAIERFAMRTADELRWRPLQPWDLPGVTVALRRKFEAPVFASAEPPAPTPKASEDSPERLNPPVAPHGVSADVADALASEDFRPLYTVEMDENARDLEALLDHLSKSKARVAEFVALDEPLPTLMPSTDPAAVLWWTRPPSGWTRRICVPIVLDTID